MKYSLYITLILFVFNLNVTNAQQGTVEIYEDDKITELLRLKTMLSKENKLSDGFTIQLYYGELKQANTIIKDYQKSRALWKATIEYETPNYKVWVGNFVTRLEADRALLEIQKEFPNAFVFRPDRRN
ncbi:SPOR domain-containing protein [Planktosalinus lacus]|nr:SPOR domain-containing protein [Planktosalinus lacus]